MYYTHGYCIDVHRARQEIFFQIREKFLGVRFGLLKRAEKSAETEPER